MVLRQIKPRMLKLTITRGQSNISIVFICVSCTENDYYRVGSTVQLRFDCRSYCGRSRRMQGFSSVLVLIEKICQTLKTVFGHIFKHAPRNSTKILRYSSYFKSLLGVWKCVHTWSLVFDIIHHRRFRPKNLTGVLL